MAQSQAQRTGVEEVLKYFTVYDQRAVCMGQSDASKTILQQILPEVSIALEFAHKTTGT